MKVKPFRQSLYVLSILLAATGVEAGRGEEHFPQPLPYYGEIARKMGEMLSKNHLLQRPLDDSISKKAWTNLITSFDFDRSIFLQGDLEKFKAMETGIDDAVKSGDISFGYEVYRVFRQRLTERYTFVTNRLEQPFDFTRDESYVWKRKDVQWPADLKEQDELWRKRIKNEMLIQLLAKELDAENATNRTAKAESAKEAAPEGGTNTVKKAAPPPPTPKESIAERYKQYLYVVQDMDEEAVLQRYLSAIATAYDPHTDYMSPLRKEDFDINMNLLLCGIGAQLRSEDGAAKIMEIIPGGPADRDKRAQRLVKGDKIIGVGQGEEKIESILHLPLDKAVKKIRGEKGSKVTLNVIPASDPSGATTKLVDLIRDEIKLEEQAATGHVARVTLKDGTRRALGVVRLPTFYGTMDKRPGQKGFRSATVDIVKQITEFNRENVSGMILDLRNNGGGSLREAILLTGLFVRSGPAVQVREPRHIAVLPVPNASNAMAFRKPVIVLINRASASASEIVAGALQDYGRALIIGDTQSHGKGSVQSVLPMGSEKFGSMKITTASFYRITGSSTQIKGVHSDIVIPSFLDDMDIGEDKLPGALPWTEIEESLYIPVSEPRKFLPRLKKLSAERLAANDQYKQHIRMIRRFNEQRKRTALPLEINARRALMREEEKMRKIEEKMFELDKGSKDPDKNDVVLMEALNILSDWITEAGGGEIPMETEGDLRARLLRIFGSSH